MTSEGLEREREVAAVWVEKRNTGMIDIKSDLGNENLAACCFPCRGVMLFPDYVLLHTHEKKKKKSPTKHSAEWA